MGFEKEKIKQIRGLILFVAVIVLTIMYSGSLLAGIGVIWSISTPFIAGAAIAFVLNIPLRAIENKLLKKWNGKSAKVAKRPISIFLSIIFISAVIALVIRLVVPALGETFGLLGEQIPIFFGRMIDWLEKVAASNPEILAELQKLENMQIDWKSLWDTVGGFLTTGMGSVLTSTFSVASSIVGGITNTFIAFVFAVYILTQKEKLANQGHRILTAYLPEKIWKRTEYVLALLYKNFSNFISGQCAEAVILGCMFVIVMTIFQFPYVLLIGVLIAFMSLIPIVGAFVGCAIGAFLILMNNPVQAVWFSVLFLVLQQIEGNLIYPRVVGGSVGLPSIWVLAAVSLGGSLFGVVGMLCFIPLVSTFYCLLKENVNARNAEKGKAQNGAMTAPSTVASPNSGTNKKNTGKRRRK